MTSRTLSATVLTALLGISSAACQSGICPEIGCQPRVTLTYAHPITGAYLVSVGVDGRTFYASCPGPASPTGPMGIQSCDEVALTLAGVDLGHGSNQTLPVQVTIDDGTPIQVTATLADIVNSRDCDVVCFDHRGTVAN